jgi:methylase of polypeptide subunit release factors
MLRSAYRLYLRLVTPLRHSAALHRALFGYRPCRGGGHPENWDWTTLALRKAMRQHLHPATSFLDMGTGSTGVLALHAALRFRCRRIVGVDFIPGVVAQAQRNATAAGIEATFICSDLFAGITERFDVIAFNAPYLAEPKGRRLGLLEEPTIARRLSGGPTGACTIKRFLAQAPDKLLPGGVVLLGVNHFHIAPAVVRDAILQSDLAVAAGVTVPLCRSTAYVLRRRGAPE